MGWELQYFQRGFMLISCTSREDVQCVSHWGGYIFDYLETTQNDLTRTCGGVEGCGWVGGWLQLERMQWERQVADSRSCSGRTGATGATSGHMPSKLGGGGGQEAISVKVPIPSWLPFHTDNLPGLAATCALSTPACLPATPYQKAACLPRVVDHLLAGLPACLCRDTH